MPVIDLQSYLGLPQAPPTNPVFNRTRQLAAGSPYENALALVQQADQVRGGRASAALQAMQNQYDTIAQQAANLRMQQEADAQAEQATAYLTDLDHESPDYLAKRSDLNRRFPLAAMNPKVQQIYRTYDSLYDDNARAAQAQAQAETAWGKEIGEAAALGVPVEELRKLQAGDYPSLGAAKSRYAKKNGDGSSANDPREKYFQSLLQNDIANDVDADVPKTAAQWAERYHELRTPLFPDEYQAKSPTALPPDVIKGARDNMAKLDAAGRAAAIARAKANGIPTAELEKMATELPLPVAQPAVDELPPTRDEFQQQKRQQEEQQRTNELEQQVVKKWVEAENDLREPLLKVLPTDPKERLVELRAIWNGEPVPTGEIVQESGAPVTQVASAHYLEKMGLPYDQVRFEHPQRWGSDKVTNIEVVKALARKLFYEKTGIDLLKTTQPEAAMPTGEAPVKIKSVRLVPPK